MKNVSFGWESDMINGHGVSAAYPVLKPIIIRAYQFYLGLMAWNTTGIFNTSGWSEVLFSAQFSNLPAQTEFGPGLLWDQTGGTYNLVTGNVDNGKQNMHGGQNLVASSICTAVLKGFVGVENTVNKVITLSNLNILVPAGSQFTTTANHAGFGPVDFECQGNLFYDDAS